MIRILDIEKLKVKHASLSEKQNKLVAKIDAMRRKLHKMSSNDKNDSKVSKQQLLLEQEEIKLRTSLKSRQDMKKRQNEDSNPDDDQEEVDRLKNSDDEFDEFFDRT